MSDDTNSSTVETVGSEADSIRAKADAIVQAAKMAQEAPLEVDNVERDLRGIIEHAEAALDAVEAERRSADTAEREPADDHHAHQPRSFGASDRSRLGVGVDAGQAGSKTDH
jgi:uncharacterized coiled-coil DUF342 family protein